MELNRQLLVALAALFSFYNILRGVVTLQQTANPWPSIAAMVLYGTATALTLWWRPARTLPLWLGCFNLAMAIVVPVLVTSQLDGTVNNGYATWHVASIGVLMVMTVVRGRELLAWTGVIFLSVYSTAWAGFSFAVKMGVSGALMWVAMASLLARLLARTRREEAEYIAAERAAADWQAAQDAHDIERSLRLEATTRRAMPVLRDIILAGGELSDEERLDCRVVEAGLRDEIRGRVLLDDAVRLAAESARRRGVHLALLDEGTLEDLPEETMAGYRERIAEILRETRSERVIVRTAPSDTGTAVTIAGLSPSTDPEDPEDAVDLWLALPRPSSTPRPSIVPSITRAR